MGAHFPVLLILAIVAVVDHRKGGGGPLLHENVVVEPVVPVKDGHKAHHLCPVGDVIGGVPGAGAAAHAGQGAADQVVDHGHPFCGHPQGGLREEDIVVDEGGAVAHLHKDILAHHAALELLGKGGPLVVVEQVLGDAGTLGLPVAPNAHGAVVDVVAAVYHVDGGVHLDAGNLRAPQLHHVVDVVDVVVLNKGEHASHPADDASLLAVVDVAPPHDVAANLFLQPAVVLSPAHGVPLHLGRAFHMFGGEVVIVVRVVVFAQGDARAFGVGNVAVLNNPPLGPVWANHPILIGGGRGPGGGCLGDSKPADGDVVHPGLRGNKALPAHVDLHVFPVGISPLEVGVKHGLVPFLLGIPLVDRGLRLPRALIYLSLQAGLQAVRFVQGLPV